jgi:hypothetical protein
MALFDSSVTAPGSYAAPLINFAQLGDLVSDFYKGVEDCGSMIWHAPSRTACRPRT